MKTGFEIKIELTIKIESNDKARKQALRTLK